MCVRVQTGLDVTLDHILAGSHRDPRNAARDVYRHPKQGLIFFGIRRDMTVVEVWPSGGWWTEILAPLLKEEGKYYAAWYATQAAGASDYAKEQEKKFDAKLAERPDLYGKVIKTHLLAPAFVDMAPKGSADLVLTFRNVHNWAKAGNAEAMFKTFYDVLKPGGTLGVVDHRAKPGTVVSASDRERLPDRGVRDRVGRSTPGSSWRRSRRSMPIRRTPPITRGACGRCHPPSRLGNQDRDKYLAIGESDRMTLKFVKPVR